MQHQAAAAAAVLQHPCTCACTPVHAAPPVVGR
jgi:hypothetical protein